MDTLRKWQLLVLLSALYSAAPAFAGTDWKVAFTASGGGVTGTCAIGVRADATDVQDYAYDVRAMLSSLNSNAVFCYFPHPEWNDIVTVHFKEDIRADGIEKQWVMEILPTFSGEIILGWPELQQKLAGYQAYLTDIEGTGANVDMLADASVAFDGVANRARRFAITVIAPSLSAPDTLWATERNLMVRLGWTRSDAPAVAGYHLYRKLPDREYERINSDLLDPLKENYLDNLSQVVHDSRRSVTVLYVLKTIAAGPSETVIHESNEVAVTIETARSGRVRRSR